MNSKSSPFSHLDGRGRPQMVQVSDKPLTQRKAVAEGWVRVSTPLVEAIRHQQLAKGALLDVAQLAGIQAAKRTAELIPLCHALPIEAIEVRAELQDQRVYLWSQVCTTWKTGVEMEALTAVTVAALTVIDMGKAIDPAMVIEGVRLVEKSGGMSGDYHAEVLAP